MNKQRWADENERRDLSWMRTGIHDVLESSDGIREDVDLRTRRERNSVEDMAACSGKG